MVLNIGLRDHEEVAVSPSSSTCGLLSCECIGFMWQKPPCEASHLFVPSVHAGFSANESIPTSRDTHSYTVHFLSEALAEQCPHFSTPVARAQSGTSTFNWAVVLVTGGSAREGTQRTRLSEGISHSFWCFCSPRTLCCVSSSRCFNQQGDFANFYGTATFSHSLSPL